MKVLVSRNIRNLFSPVLVVRGYSSSLQGWLVDLRGYDDDGEKCFCGWTEVIHTVKIDEVRQIVDVESFGKSADKIDKELCSFRLYGGGGIPFQLKSNSLPHAHAQTIKTYYWHQDSKIKKSQVHTKTKTFANSDKQDLPLRYQVYQGRLLASFQEDASMSMLVKTQDCKVAKMIKTNKEKI
ncbi:hypothetical protein Tco_0686612 [Tanacetum coccineum]